MCDDRMMRSYWRWRIFMGFCCGPWFIKSFFSTCTWERGWGLSTHSEPVKASETERCGTPFMRGMRELQEASGGILEMMSKKLVGRSAGLRFWWADCDLCVVHL